MKVSILFIILLLAGVTQAQVNSTAFDPNCYFPRIGVSGEIDTIYGAHESQYLGSGLLNIGPTPGDSYGRLSCVLDYDNVNSMVRDSVFSAGHLFNLHKLHILGENTINYSIRRGHFRSPKYSDILYSTRTSKPARIYWQDDQGEFDSSRYTELRTNIKAKFYNDYVPLLPYSSHLSSDSVEDIVYSVLVGNTNTQSDSIFLIYFIGGEQLMKKGKIAYQDSTKFFDTIPPPWVDRIRGVSQGDYRGVGRADIIASDLYGNLFYYKNDPPFSLSGLVSALKFDTIFAKWQNPHSLVPNSENHLSMHAISKHGNDSSYDFLPPFETQYGSRTIQELRIFKGGKDFGTKRWMADSASFVIHEPYFYDNNFRVSRFGGVGLHDCGDMTGTGNHVLYIGADLDGGFYGYHFFYVLGSAIDDKVDMFIGPIPNSGDGFLDTLTADNDNLQDAILGLSGFGLNNGNEAVGTIYVIHGSNKIPVKTNRVLPISQNDISINVFPNPVTNGKCILDLRSAPEEDIQVNIFDLLGRKVFSENIYTPFVNPLHPIVIRTLPNGTYVIELEGKTFNRRIHLLILK